MPHPDRDPQADENQQEDVDYRTFAGTVLWPTTPSLLSDTTLCPACLTPLASAVCGSCGLDLTHPAASELASTSANAVAALDLRLQLIGRIRHDTTRAGAAAPQPEAARPSPQTAPFETSQVPETAASTTPAMSTAPATSTAPARNTEPAEHARPSAVRPARRSSVQIALLIAGVSLLSVFAIFFLVYAFINFGIVWRSVIIAGITVAAFASASLLRRRSLTASAEGIAVLALVLVYLDAYALRANDFFGLLAVDGTLYWGAALAMTGGAFIGWHRLSAVRSASLVGWLTLAPGLGLLSWGIGTELEPGLRLFTAFSVAALAGLGHSLVPHGDFRGRTERVLLLSTSAAALVGAFVSAWVVELDTDWGGAIACVMVGATGIVLALTAVISRSSTPATRAFGLAFASVTGVASAAAATVAALRIEPHAHTAAIITPLLAAAAVALLFEACMRRLGGRNGVPLRRASRFAAGGAAGVLGLVAVLPVSLAIAPVFSALFAAGDRPWGSDASDIRLTDIVDDSGAAVLALAGVVALATASWSLSGTIRTRAKALAWGSAAVLTLAAAQLPSFWHVLAAWFLLAATALVLLLRARTAPALSAFRPCLTALLAVNGGLMLISGWASLDTWATTTVAAICLLLACRALGASPTGNAALLGAAITLLLHGTGAVAGHYARATGVHGIGEQIDMATLVALAGVALLIPAALPWRSMLTTLDRRVTFWISAAAALAAAVTLWRLLELSPIGDESIPLLLPQPITGLMTSILLLGGLVLWIGLRANSLLRIEKIGASIALGPAVYWVADSFARVTGLPEFAHQVVPVTAALISAAGALTITLLRPSTSPRWARELGVGLVGVPAVLVAIADGSTAGWLVLLIAAVTVLLIAIDHDGLFSSGSARKHLGWGALAFATAGLWWRLSGSQVEALEPYVLPLTAALLAISAFVHRAASTTAAANGRAGLNRVAPFIALAGLLVAVLPLAADAITGDLGRAITISAVCALLSIAGSLVVTRGGLRPYLDAAALAGTIGVIVTAVGRALQAGPGGLTLDSWLMAMVLVLLVAAFAQARRRGDSSERWRAIAGQTLGVLSIVAFTLIETTAFADPTLGSLRVLASIALLAAFHVIAHAVDHAPFSRLLAVVSICLAGLTAVTGLLADALEPVELGSVPIAIALLVTGSMRLAESTAARSWLTLGPGVAVLLFPSLIATASSPELWRLVALGVASVTVLVAGAVRRLQAPFLLGLAAALIHGFATFAPQIRAVYESQEWWLWAGLAGVVLVLLAIRYERRIQNLKDVVMRITALR